MCSEIIVDICTVFIAVCALIVAWKQGKYSREHNKLSVRPYLTLSTFTFEKSTKYANEVYITIKNIGSGPAVRISDFKIFYQHKPISPITIDNIIEYINSIFKYTEYVTAKVLNENDGLGVNEETKIIDIKFPNKIPDNMPIENIRNKLKCFEIRFKYENIYGDTFNFPFKNIK